MESEGQLLGCVFDMSVKMKMALLAPNSTHCNTLQMKGW